MKMWHGGYYVPKAALPTAARDTPVATSKARLLRSSQQREGGMSVPNRAGGVGTKPSCREPHFP